MKVLGLVASVKIPTFTRATPFSTVPTFSTPLTIMVTLPVAFSFILMTNVTLLSTVTSIPSKVNGVSNLSTPNDSLELLAL